MIVFDLACGAGHRFEAWFRSGASFDEQAAAGALSCPLCSDSTITKAPMAPRVGRRTHDRPDERRESAEEAQPAADEAGKGSAVSNAPLRTSSSPPVPEAMAKALSHIRATIEATCEDVGPRFAEEARRIHFGEADSRGIYGEASAEDAAALRDEGIACQSLPWWRRRND